MSDSKKLKVIIIGNSTVGKTSLITQFKQKRFLQQTTSTVGVDMTSEKDVMIGDQKFEIFIWDTAGQEKYLSMLKLSTRDANAAIICFDLSDQNSLKTVQSWIKFLRDECPQTVQIIIFGTKKDLQVKYTEAELQEYLQSLKYVFQEDFLIMQTSSKTGDGINDAFYKSFTLAAQMNIKRKFSENQNSNQRSFKLSAIAKNNNVTATQEILSNTNSISQSQIIPEQNPNSGCC